MVNIIAQIFLKIDKIFFCLYINLWVKYDI